MVYYQLPDGRLVQISIEMLLNMTPQLEQDLMASSQGFHTSNPLVELYLDDSDDEEVKPKKKSSKDDYEPLDDEEFDEEDEEQEDYAPDMLTDGDDDPIGEFDWNNIPDEE